MISYAITNNSHSELNTNTQRDSHTNCFIIYAMYLCICQSFDENYGFFGYTFYSYITRRFSIFIPRMRRKFQLFINANEFLNQTNRSSASTYLLFMLKKPRICHTVYSFAQQTAWEQCVCFEFE